MAGRIALCSRGKPFDIVVNDKPVRAFPGETIAGVLLAAGQTVFRRTRESDAPRGVFCGMGVCYDCLVDVQGGSLVRACMTAAEPGMVITVPSRPEVVS
jgi:predicted molibdopterin-dependent oxidoreductase YjgC